MYVCSGFFIFCTIKHTNSQLSLTNPFVGVPCQTDLSDRKAGEAGMQVADVGMELQVFMLLLLQIKL